MFKSWIKNTPLRIAANIFVVLIVYNVLVVTLVHVEKISAQSALTNYANAYWYSIVTLTTVGYGDLFPTTTYGRLIGFVLVLGSLVFYALVIGGFSSIILTIKENSKLGHNGINYKSHAVIIGWSDFSRMVCDQLLGVGKQVAVVTNDRRDIDFIHDKYHSRNLFTLYSDLKNFDMLDKTNISESSMVFVNLEDDTDNLVSIINLRKIYPQLEFVVTLENAELRDTFVAAGVTRVITKYEISAKLLASYMFEPDVASYAESIMSVAREDADYDIKEFLVTESNPYVGQPYQEVFFDLKKKYNSVLIGITKWDKAGNRRLLKNPLGDLTIASGDYLIVILNGKAFKLLKRIFQVEEGVVQTKPK